ncbi:MAG: hypothetical protein SFX18_03665 [Pirellulales bacterium]|nr:hypothetical protein [Pirellulales bacterium]
MPANPANTPTSTVPPSRTSSFPRIHIVRKALAAQLHSTVLCTALAVIGSWLTTLTLALLLAVKLRAHGLDDATIRDLLRGRDAHGATFGLWLDWAIWDLLARGWWALLAGYLTQFGPPRFRGTRMLAVGWLVGLAWIGESAVNPLGATAQLTPVLLWLTMIASCLGGCLAFWGVSAPSRTTESNHGCISS